MFQALAVRDFRCLWVSNLAASFAMQMQMVARGWLIYDMTSSPLALTWVMLSFMLPSFVFSLAGGVVADRMRKKAIMITSQLLNTAATLLLATIVFRGDVTFWHFIWFGLFNGTVLSFSMPARASVIPEIVPRHVVVNAMALQSATFNLSRIAGPAVAGFLIAWFAGGDTTSHSGVGIVFYAIAGLYIISVSGTAMLHYDGAPQRQTETRVLHDLAEGFTYMRRERVILGLVIMGLVPMTFGWAPSMLMPAFNQDVIGGDPQTLGYLMTAMGVGALAGSLTLARLGDIGHKGRVLFIAAYLWAVAIIGFSLSGVLAIAMLFGLFTGAFSSVMGSLNMSVVQLAVRPEIRGRVMAINMMTHGLMPLFFLPISALAEWLGIATALFASGLLLAATMLATGRLFPELLRIDKGHSGEPVRPAPRERQPQPAPEASVPLPTASNTEPRRSTA